MAKRDTLYCVVYYVGGTERGEWRRTLAMSKEEAKSAQSETARMGYYAMVVDYNLSINIGLPEGAPRK